MPKYKELKREFERDLRGFLQERVGRAVSVEELQVLRATFIAERMPRGADAIASAKASDLLRPRPPEEVANAYILSDDLKEAMTKADVAQRVGRYSYDYYGGSRYLGATFKFQPNRKRTWADVLKVDPRAVKAAFGLSYESDPVDTVVQMSERLLGCAFNADFGDDMLRAYADRHKFSLRERGYQAVIAAAVKSGVTLSDLRETADQTLLPAPNVAEIDIWHERYDAAVQAGADPDDAAKIADNAMRKAQIGDLGL